MYYVLLMVLIIILRLFFIRLNKANCKTELVLYCLLIFIFIGFRNINVGSDTSDYVYNFLSRGNMSIKSIIDKYSGNNEIGYLLCTKALYFLFPYGQALLIFEALVISVCLYIFVKNSCKNYFLAIIVFLSFGLFSFCMSGIRQTLAIGFCMIAYIYARKEKYLMYFIFLAIACSFHLSAILFLLIFIVNKLLKKINIKLIALIGSISVALFVNQILGYFSSIRDKWTAYADIEATGNGFIFFAIIILILILIEYINYKKNKYKSYDTRSSYILIPIWVGRLISRTFERIALYFMPSMMCSISNDLSDYKYSNDKIEKVLYYCVIIFIIALYVYRYYGANYSFFSI